MKTEKEKMLSNELYNHKDAELTKERNHAYELTLNRVAAMNKKNILAKWFMAFHKHHRYGLTIR